MRSDGCDAMLYELIVIDINWHLRCSAMQCVCCIEIGFGFAWIGLCVVVVWLWLWLWLCVFLIGAGERRCG